MSHQPETTDVPVAVAVPTFNGAAHVAEAIGSILEQRGVAFDLIVSDDHSDDRTPEVVRALAGDRAWVEVNHQRLGLAGNWNRCFELSQTALVAVFHQDDVMGPGHLADHIAAFARDDAIGLVASASEVIDEEGNPVPETVVARGGLGPIDRIVEPGGLAVAMAGGNPLRCSAVTIRRAAFDEAGGFDPSLRYVLDAEFWLRVSRRWRIAWLARPSVKVRWHRESETHRFKPGLADLEESARLLETLVSVDLKGAPNLSQLQRTANRRLARAYLNRAQDALRAGRTGLARKALGRGLGQAPRVATELVRDPRLGLQMATLALAPSVAGRLFGRSESE
ncbi:MAG: glycosyltransferase family 2 protein [Isosphaeraceae bacterium]